MTERGAVWHVSTFNSKAHDRSNFSCGAPELDAYIRDYASQDAKRNVARVFVAVAANSEIVAGYYSLSAASFQTTSLPPEQARRLPRYPVPAALLGRLAVDDRHKGKGLGAFLLMDALNRVVHASEILAVQALIVDARDASASAFYQRYGFAPFTDNKSRLFLPLATIRQLIGVP